MKVASNAGTAVILLFLSIILLLAMFGAEFWFRSDGAFFMSVSVPFGMAVGALLRHLTGESTPGLPPIPPSPGGGTSTLSMSATTGPPQPATDPGTTATVEQKIIEAKS